MGMGANMPGYTDKVLTETYRDKRYEEDLTKLYFEVLEKLDRANFAPTMDNIKTAFSAVKTFSEGMIYSKDHLKLYRDKIRPVLHDIQTILYGNPRDMNVVSKSLDYDAGLQSIKGSVVLKNGVNLLNEMSEVLFLVKQYAYDQGLLLPKPVEKKLGMDGIENTLMQ